MLSSARAARGSFRLSALFKDYVILPVKEYAQLKEVGVEGGRGGREGRGGEGREGGRGGGQGLEGWEKQEKRGESKRKNL